MIRIVESLTVVVKVYDTARDREARGTPVAEREVTTPAQLEAVVGEFGFPAKYLAFESIRGVRLKSKAAASMLLALAGVQPANCEELVLEGRYVVIEPSGTRGFTPDDHEVEVPLGTELNYISPAPAGYFRFRVGSSSDFVDLRPGAVRDLAGATV